MTRCEDYPCCGHTDGLPCDWTYTPEARAFDMAHAMCDHSAGVCDAWEDCDEDHQCADCGECVDACICDDRDGCEHEDTRWEWATAHAFCADCDERLPSRDDDLDGAPSYRPGMGPDDPVRCDND